MEQDQAEQGGESDRQATYRYLQRRSVCPPMRQALDKTHQG